MNGGWINMTSAEFWKSLAEYYGMSFPYEQIPNESWRYTLSLIKPIKLATFMRDLRSNVTKFTRRCPTPGELLQYFDVTPTSGGISINRQREFEAVQGPLNKEYGKLLTALSTAPEELFKPMWERLNTMRTYMLNNEAHKDKENIRLYSLTDIN